LIHRFRRLHLQACGLDEFAVQQATNLVIALE
jgi:hypothetical protein